MGNVLLKLDILCRHEIELDVRQSKNLQDYVCIYTILSDTINYKFWYKTQFI